MQDGAHSEAARRDVSKYITSAGARTAALMTWKWLHVKSTSTYTEAGYLGQRGASGRRSFLN